MIRIGKAVAKKNSIQSSQEIVLKKLHVISGFRYPQTLNQFGPIYVIILCYNYIGLLFSRIRKKTAALPSKKAYYIITQIGTASVQASRLPNLKSMPQTIKFS